jgi:hypothetical protein
MHDQQEQEWFLAGFDCGEAVGHQRALDDGSLNDLRKDGVWQSGREYGRAEGYRQGVSDAYDRALGEWCDAVTGQPYTVFVQCPTCHPAPLFASKTRRAA